MQELPHTSFPFIFDRLQPLPKPGERVYDVLMYDPDALRHIQFKKHPNDSVIQLLHEALYDWIGHK